MTKEEGRSASRSWWIFLAIAIVLCLLCFATSDQNRSILWSSPASYESWSSSTERDSWILDTRSDYKIKLPVQEEFDIPAQREYDFDISEICVPIAGITREVIAINKKIPGPLIQAVEGDTVVVRVKNRMKNKDTSLHFHGQSMNHTNFNDGSIGMTQCGIAPGESFEYRFVAGPSGTYWYHSHAKLQALQGFVGPMIVFSREEGKLLSHPTEQQVLLLSDMYDKSPDDLMDSYREPWIGGTTEPVPGIAMAQGSLSPEINIPHKGPLKLRVVNAASFTAFRIQIGNPGLKFQVIEADGTALRPTEVDHLVIFPAQRYSILLEVDHVEWLFSIPLSEFYDDANIALYQRSSALRTLLRTDIDALLNKMPASSGSKPNFPKTALIDQYFEPLESTLPPQHSDFTKFVDLTMTRTEDGSVAGAINGKIFSTEDWQYSLADLLDQSSEVLPRHEGGHAMHHSHRQDHQAISAEQKFPNALLFTRDWAVADLIIRNYDDGFHPMHLHGHDMWIMERGNIDNSTQPLTWKRPLKRDVVGVPQNEWVQVRVVLDNPGLWWFHCHIPWHSLTGMRTAILSQPGKLVGQSAPREWWQLCLKSENH